MNNKNKRKINKVDSESESEKSLIAMEGGLISNDEMQAEENHLANSRYNVTIKLDTLPRVNWKGIEKHIQMKKN